MRKLTSPLLCLSLIAIGMSTGCTLCRNDHICDYAGVGGKWQRGNPTCGRVGSILSDAGAYQSGSTVEFGANYGNSWGLVEQPESVAAPEEQLFEGELFQGAAEEPLEPGTIMIGP